MENEENIQQVTEVVESENIWGGEKTCWRESFVELESKNKTIAEDDCRASHASFRGFHKKQHKKFST